METEEEQEEALVLSDLGEEYSTLDEVLAPLVRCASLC